MRRGTVRLVAALAAVVTLAPPLGAQVSAGQVDTFEDGTTNNWIVRLLPFMPPHPAPPAPVATGGPAGDGDGYLRLTAVGGAGGMSPDPGSRLAVLNYAGQWVGDYLAAGIGAIRLDARNFGESELSLRILFENPALPPAPGPPTALAVSAFPIVLPGLSGWRSLTFPLFGPGGLVGIDGPGGPSDVRALLANTTAIRLIHLPASSPPAPNGPPVVASLGIDNVAAVAVVPEPSTLALCAGGAALLALTSARRARRAPSRRC